MLQKSLWRAVLIVVISVALATPAKADNLSNAGRNIVIGIVAVTAAIAVVATVVIIHYSKKQTITGCVKPTENGMTITDEKDQRIYTLSGNTGGVMPGERMQLRGQKLKSMGPDKTPIWDARAVIKDFGVCRPYPDEAPSLSQIGSSENLTTISDHGLGFNERSAISKLKAKCILSLSQEDISAQILPIERIF